MQQQQQQQTKRKTTYQRRRNGSAASNVDAETIIGGLRNFKGKEDDYNTTEIDNENETKNIYDEQPENVTKKLNSEFVLFDLIAKKSAGTSRADEGTRHQLFPEERPRRLVRKLRKGRTPDDSE